MIIARGKDDAFGCGEAHILVILIEGDNASYATVFDNELLSGGVVEKLNTVLFLGKLRQHADALGVALGRLAVANRIPVSRMLVGRCEVAFAHGVPMLVPFKLLGAVQHIHDGLFAAVGPDLKELAIGAILVFFNQLAQDLLDSRVIALVVEETCRRASLCDGCADLLKDGYACALFAGGHGRRDARGAGADYDDVVLHGLGNLIVRDGFGCKEEAGSP